jgi:hypothetical protein
MMQILSVKPLFGYAARTHRQTLGEASTAVVMKSKLAKIPRASAQPDAEIFFDGLTSMEFKTLKIPDSQRAASDFTR